MRKLLLASLLVCVNLGGCDGGGENQNKTIGKKLSDVQLCQLKYGATTKAQTIELFGEPTTQVGGTASALFIYDYLVMEGNNAIATEAIALFYDSAGLLDDVTIVGRPFPDCLKK